MYLINLLFLSAVLFTNICYQHTLQHEKYYCEIVTGKYILATKSIENRYRDRLSRVKNG